MDGEFGAPCDGRAHAAAHRASSADTAVGNDAAEAETRTRPGAHGAGRAGAGRRAARGDGGGGIAPDDVWLGDLSTCATEHANELHERRRPRESGRIGLWRGRPRWGVSDR